MSMNPLIRTNLLVLGLALSIATFAEAPKPISVPPGDLVAALESIAKQAGVELLFDINELKGIKTEGVDGTLTSEDAIRKLLQGTQLDLSTDESTGAMMIGRRKAAVSQEAADAAATDNLRLAQAAGGESAEGEEGKSDLQEIVVTGTHIRGAQALPMPSVNFTREDIEKTGYARVEELFRSLPQNLASVGVKAGEGASDIASSNSDRATGIDLRGLGPQSTLVLLNGQRRAPAVLGRVVDISAIPLSVIERVEVVTGGRSAIYGSDAVAGVVNMTTRRDFEGAESSVYYGGAGDGAARLQLSQIIGRRADRGGFVAAYDYSDNNSLDATEAGVVRAPSAVGLTPTPGAFDLQPESTRHSGYLSGRYSLTDRAELHADALYTSDDSDHIFSYDAGGVFTQRTKGSIDQYSVSPGVDLHLNDDWKLGIAGVYGKLEVDQSFTATFGGFPAGDGVVDSEASLTSISAIVDGPLVAAQRVTIKTAVGAEYREEDLGSARFILDENRTVSSAFGEALISLLPTQAGRHRLQLSIAGRYSDYSDFGDSFDPQFGISWNSGGGLTVRGAYSTAFRAPDLDSLNEDRISAVFLFTQPDPAQGNALVPTIGVVGPNAALQPEEADTWSVGFDYALPMATDTKISMSYFDIEYSGRIDEPLDIIDMFSALLNEERYPSLVDRAPSLGNLDQLLDLAVSQGGFGDLIGEGFDPTTTSLQNAYPNVVFFNNRLNNISEETMTGLDLMLDGTLASGAGTFSFGLNGAYYFEYKRRLLSRTAIIPQLNSPGKTVDFRFRAQAGWERAPFGVFVYLNHTDSYTDTLAVPARDIGSWTTVDATFRFNASNRATSGFLHGLTATLGIQNLFDEEPPLFLSDTFGVAFDPANADARGRFLSLGLVKRW